MKKLKTLLVLLTLLTLFTLNGFAQDIPVVTLTSPGSSTDVIFSPDGQTIASVRDRFGIQFWDTMTASLRQTFIAERINSIAFSPDGALLAIVNRLGYAVWVWEVNTESVRAFEGHTSYVQSVAFSPDGKTLASGSWDRTVRLWNTETGRFEQILIDHTGEVNSIAFSPNGVLLASGGKDQTLRLWDVKTGEVIRRLEGHARSVNHVAFSPDSKILASSGDETVRLWDVDTGEVLHNIRASYATKSRVAFSPDGKTLASKRGIQLSLYDVKTGFLKQTLTTGAGGIAFSPDGALLASGGQDEKTISHGPDVIWLWDTHTLQEVRIITGHRSAVHSVAFSPDGQTVVSGSGQGWGIFFWESRTKKYLRSLPATGGKLLFSADGKILASSGSGRTDALRLWDVNTDKEIISFSAHLIDSFAFSPDGKMLAVGARSASYGAGSIYLLHVATGAIVFTLTGHQSGAVASVAFSPDGKTLASGSSGYNLSLAPYLRDLGDTTILLWDAATGAHQRTLAGHTDSITSVAFSPDSKTLISGSADATIRFWDVPTGADRFTLTAHVAAVTSIALSGDGKTLVSGSTDTAIKFWDVSMLFEGVEEIQSLFADVNSDGVVNIQDLVLVASSFGQSVPEEDNPADVNKDGVVNIIDLVEVSAAIESNQNAAPRTFSQLQEANLTQAEVQKWLVQAQQLNLTDPTAQRGIRFLEQLLLALTPKETALLPNYPNPFNPETWIPYQLAADANVTVTIYAADGKLVRTLELGHQPAGNYQTKHRAAYWNGRNKFGERVASGVYFYTLTAGNFTSTRKMLIRK